MGWPYTIQTLTREQKTLRRETINRYAALAQLSVVAPVLLFVLYRALRTLYTAAVKPRVDAKGATYTVVPSSPTLKKSRASAQGQWITVLRQMRWWLDSEVRFAGTQWGTWDQWLLGLVWGGWMLCFSVIGTGNDYLHLTKRFGAIALSQFPFQYLLSLKSVSPLCLLFHTSHERINRFHRVLGRIIYLLLIIHSMLYLNYYLVTSQLSKLYGIVVLAGITCLTLLSTLMFTSLSSVRAYSYRLFFIVHLITAFGVPLTLFLHAPKHVVFFVFESLFVFVVDLIARKLDTFTAISTLERLPGTNLIKIVIPVPENRSERFVSPGQHVYLSIPPASRPHDLKQGVLFEFLFNPFTISSYSPDSGELVLIARHRNGPLTSQLAKLVHDNTHQHGHTNQHTGTSATKTAGIKLNIEGPYGSLAAKFSSIASADRILLVAGGVGATFVLPVYAALKSRETGPGVRLIWAVRHASEATWAVLSATSVSENGIAEAETPLTPTSPRKSILDDPDVELYLTGNILSSSSGSRQHSPPQKQQSGAAPAVPVTRLGEGDTAEEEGVELMSAMEKNSKRPNLPRIVNDAFRLGGEETVAVVVCGPRGIGRDVRSAVAPWVRRGRKVIWHEEVFGD